MPNKNFLASDPDEAHDDEGPEAFVPDEAPVPADSTLIEDLRKSVVMLMQDMSERRRSRMHIEPDAFNEATALLARLSGKPAGV